MTAALAIAPVVALPLAGALAAVVAGRRGALLAVAVTAGIAAALGWLVAGVATEGTARLALGGWEPPLGIMLRADGLAAAFLVMTAVVMAAVVGVARHHFTHGAGEDRAAWAFWPLALLLWASLNAVFVSRDLFNLYVGLELLTLAAVALVAIEGKAGNIAAALRYMVFALMGSLLYLLGAVLLYAAHGTLDIALLGERDAANADAIALALMTAGLMAKMALFPFHAWLPPAHSGAPAPASAMLSALVPKAAFYILLRLWLDAAPDLAAPAALALMGALGAVAVLYGSVLAFRQERLKLIIAYSTVAQLGYLMLVFPLAGGPAAAEPWAEPARAGAIFQAVSHGLAKGAMFLCAGLWIRAVGHDRLEGLRGIARVTPMTTFAFALAAITLMGLPPSGGFTAKYLMMTAAFSSGQVIWAAVMVAGGLLAAAYLYRPMALVFARDIPEGLAPVPRTLQAIPLVLAATAIALGIGSALPYALLQVGA